MILEKYDAIVTSNEDEEFSGRIRVACSGLLGDEDSELPDWVLPKFDWGWFYIPDVGEIVEIEVSISSETDEIKGQSSIDGLDVSWTGKRLWTSEEVDGAHEPRPLLDDFKENYGKRRGFATPNGHIFIFDDTPGKEKVFLTWKQGDKNQTIEMNETGYTKISNSDESQIHLDAENEQIEVTDKHGNVIRMKSGEMETEGTKITLKNATINLLDGADEPVMRGNTTKTWLDTHAHMTGMGLSGPPTVTLPTAALSRNCNVGA